MRFSATPWASELSGCRVNRDPIATPRSASFLGTREVAEHVQELLIVGVTGTLSRQATEIASMQGWSVRCLDTFPTPDQGADAASVALFVALEDPDARAGLIDDVVDDPMVELTTLIHPTASVSPSARLGQNVLIGAQCVVAMDAVVGNGVAQNALGSIEHDNRIADHVFLGTGVTLCGRVTIGTRAFIGGGAVIKPGISIAEHTLVGTGAVVVKDTEPHRTYVGNPARPLAVRP